MTNLKSQKEAFIKYVSDVQKHICDEIEAIDGKKFQIENWEREGFGYGSTRVLSGGNVIEKGGVNTSMVGGKLPDAMKERFGVEESTFFATGVSLVLHPKNPFAPTVH